MDSNINYYYRKLTEEQNISGFEDVHHIYSDATPKIYVLRENPFKEANDAVFQILGVLDNKIVGTEIHIPIQLEIINQIMQSVTGHGLSVFPECRGLGMGSKLTDQRLDFSKSKSLLLCDASQMQIPILKRLGAHIFFLPRLILLQNSFSVIEQKLGKTAAKLCSPVANLLFAMQRSLLQHKRKNILSRGITVKEYDTIPDEVEQIMAADNHPFKEVHSKEWFQWVKDCSLVSASDNVVKRFFIVYQGNRPVGFYMIKQRFYEQASHRGFRNVTLGSVVEWQSCDESALSTNEVALLAVTSFGRDVDAVELCCDTDAMARYFKHKGLVQVGAGNVVFRYRPTSVFAGIKDIGDASKWRLRPSMGDNALS